MNPPAGEHVIELLSGLHDRTTFTCGNEALDGYLRQQAGQDARRNIAMVYILRHGSPGTVAGFYTLANAMIQLVELPPGRAKKLPRYPQVPATLLGQLAVDLRHRGRGLGEFLLLDAMKRCLESSRISASFALVVDAKDETAKGFYLRYGFEPIMGQLNRLFLPLQDIERNFAGPAH